MTDFEKRNDGQIPVGIEVVGFDGRHLGYVRESHEHYLLVGTKSAHKDLEVPVQSILGIEEGKLRVHVTGQSTTSVDDEETAHRLEEKQDKASVGPTPADPMLLDASERAPKSTGSPRIRSK